MNDEQLDTRERIVRSLEKKKQSEQRKPIANLLASIPKTRRAPS